MVTGDAAAVKAERLKIRLRVLARPSRSNPEDTVYAVEVWRRWRRFIPGGAWVQVGTARDDQRTAISDAQRLLTQSAAQHGVVWTSDTVVAPGM